MLRHENTKILPLYRNLVVVAGGLYLVWWFAVEWFLQNAFNPLGSRLLVVGIFLGIWVFSFTSAFVRKRIQVLYAGGLWILNVHYFYLLYMNGGDNNWIIGSFITVLASAYCLLSLASLRAYSVFAVLLSMFMLFLLPGLRNNSVFFPGILTILFQSNIGQLMRINILKRLTESNERFQLLFNSTAEGMLLHEDRRIVGVNDAMTKMTGFSRDELIGKDLLELVHPEARAFAAERISAADAKPSETKALRKDGAMIDIEVFAKDIVYNEKILRLVTTHDLTDRRKIEEERIKSQAMQENIRAHDEFISLASHELKTPLTALKLWIQMMERDLRKTASDALFRERARKTTVLVDKQITRLATLVETMLDVSQVSTGKLRLDRKEIDFATLAREVVIILGPESESVSSPITLVAPERLLLSGDATRLTQMMNNLLTNAMKYGNQKPIKVTVSLEGMNAFLKVEDEGLGMRPEHIHRIFERFERVGVSINISGLGLGLFLAKQIAVAHGGTIGVKSEFGAGSTFTVKIPIGL